MSGSASGARFLGDVNKLGFGGGAVVGEEVGYWGRTAAGRGLVIRLDGGVWRDVVESLGTSGSVVSQRHRWRGDPAESARG